MQHRDRRTTLAALVVAVAVAGCGTTTPPTPTTGPTASPLPTASHVPSASPGPATTPTPAGAAWTPAGSLALARAATHAIVLADGRVLVVGNDNICEPGGAWDDSVRAEVFDPANGAWTSTGRLNAPRDGFVAIALPDGRALVTGGLTSAEPADGVFGAYSSAKLYDPATGQWSATGLMRTARLEPVAALLPDGTVLVAGGAYVDSGGSRVLASAEIFDPETGTWSPTGALKAARRGAKAVTLADGRVLVVGGDGGAGADGTVGPPPEVYDATRGTWTTASGATLVLPRSEFALVTLPDGGALVIGGLMPTDEEPVTMAEVERLDPKELTWSSAASLPAAVTDPAAVLLGDGRVLVAGGLPGLAAGDRSEPAANPAINNTAIFDPSTDRWSESAPLPEGRAGGQLVTLADQTVLLVGGDRGYVGEPSVPWCPEPIAEALRYVPENLASFPEVKPIAATVARSTVPRAKAKPADAKKAAASIAAFGIDLYKRMLKDPTLGLAKKNVVFSPTSIALALGMARAGANGETASQVDEVLHASGWDALGKGLNSLEQALSSRSAAWKDDEGKPRAVALRIANAAFGQAGWTIEDPFLDRIAAAFGSGLRLVDYMGDPEAAQRLINAWVKSKTAGRIPQLLAPDDVTADNRLYLVNAVYVKAEWEEWFGDATPRLFTLLDGSRIKVPTMEAWRGSPVSGHGMVPYARGKGWQAVELRFQRPEGANPLAMVLVRPDSLTTFEKSLSARKLAAITAALDAERARWDRSLDCGGPEGEGGCYPYDLHLFVPKFGIDTRAVLNDVLKAAGMPLAFQSGAADFTGIHVPADPSEQLYISRVVHQANIDVDEKGVEAAAATAVGMATGGGPSPLKRITLRLDRPFLFVLRDAETGAILFMGRVVDPSAK